MIGAIAGDIIGSVFEWNNAKTKDFSLFSPGCRFTDDTILTVALADTLLHGGDWVENLKRYYHLYPDGGYGGMFVQWAKSDDLQPYHSWGNGAPMRISPAGFAFESLGEVLNAAQRFTEVTHNHPEAIRGAQAVAAAIWHARRGKSREALKSVVEDFGYDLGRHVDELRPDVVFDVSTRGTVPLAVRAFLDSTGFEDAIRTAVSLGGDSDTIACITGGIAHAFYGGVPPAIEQQVYARLDARLGDITRRFMARFG